MQTTRSVELKCYVAEFIGTFAIVLLGCGAIAILAQDGAKHLSVNIVFGLTVATMIYALGHVSKAHFNPAVTLGFVVARRFPIRCALGYWAAQFAGGIAASFVVKAIAPTETVGATIPSVPIGTAVLIEALMTFFLMLVICGTATDKRAASGFAGAAIGGTVLINGLFSGPLTGNSLNPARSLGPALMQPAATQSLWIYFVGPCLGAVTASLLYRWLSTGNQSETPMNSCC